MPNRDFITQIQKVMDLIENNQYVFSEDIPHIDLYMDQVTTFMDEHLGMFIRDNDDKILTKTMINNYSKCDILPPSAKKRYSNDHIILLLFVYYFKHVLSIPDIKQLLDPIKDMMLTEEAPMPFGEFYDRIIKTQLDHFESFRKQIDYTLETSNALFEDVEDPKQKEILSIFASSYLLSIQATAQKFMVTQLIDKFLQPEDFKKKEDPKKSK